MTRTPGTYVVFETSEGAIVCRLFEKEAPKTVANFVDLSEGKREWTHPPLVRRLPIPLPRTIFHRVIPDFMIQAVTRWAPVSVALVTSSRMKPRIRHIVSTRRESWRWPTPAQHQRIAVFHYGRQHRLAHWQTHDFRRGRRRLRGRRENLESLSQPPGPSPQRRGG